MMKSISNIKLPRFNEKANDSISNIRKTLLNYIDIPLNIQECDTSSYVKMILQSPRIDNSPSHKKVMALNSASASKSFFPSFSKTQSTAAQSYAHALSETDSNSPSNNFVDMVGEGVERRERELTASSSPKKEFVSALSYLKSVALGYRNFSGSPQILLKKEMLNGDSITIIRQMREREKKCSEETKTKSSRDRRSVKLPLNKSKRKPIKRKFTVPGNNSLKIALEKLSLEPLYN
eukprot:TRINITY_DN7715_c0_g2_i1.p1 TRINITY_DN7715_c0_g2~~TRINITY_DN7715_c0_g2_i1.p1  ORF type:complete len:235 (+),score=28.51 TRINITY_DN7715_c0_g2_i1:131-835(+)